MKKMTMKKTVKQKIVKSESASDMDVDLPGTFYSYNVIILN